MVFTRPTAKKMAAAAFAMALACLLLGACSQNPGDTSPSAQPSSQEVLDITKFKTLGDVLAVSTGNPSSVCDEESYAAIYEVGDSFVRVAAELPAGLYEEITELDYADENYDEQFSKLAGDLVLTNVEDITSGKLSQDELDAYVGKTGKDLLADGFEFSSYYLYSDDEAGATMDKGYFSYNFVFDAAVAEDEEDNGEALKDASVTSAEYAGISSAALDELVGSEEAVPESAVKGSSLKDSPREAEYQIEVAMQYKLEEAYGDKVDDARIYVEKIYTAAEEAEDPMLADYNLGPDEVAFEVHYELHPAEGVDVNELTAATGQYDEESGWVLDKYNVGILRPNTEEGGPEYVITDFGTAF